MKLLEDRIRKDGEVKEGNVLKVDQFFESSDGYRTVSARSEKSSRRRFEGKRLNKILTIEASGIGIACRSGRIFHVPVVFAKKTQTKNIAGEVYRTQVESFTHGRII